jgi:hypothetical protein
LSIGLFNFTKNNLKKMNVLKSILLVFALVFTYGVSSAQDVTADEAYYLGTWDVLIKGTPNGDVNMPMTIEKKDGKLVGKAVNPESKEEVVFSEIAVKGTDLTFAFSMMGYDLTMILTKKDDDHANGKLMDMFDSEATRKKM